MLRAHYRRNTIFVPLFPHHNRRADDEQRCKPQLETLEPRFLMTASAGADWQNLISGGGICSCPICTGQGISGISASETAGGSGEGTIAASNPLNFLPLLSSNPNATAKLFLDFNGHTQASWGSYTNVITPVYDRDGDKTTFSNSELASIQEIWARVAEDFAPFNIDVTTIDPGGSANGVVARIAIGGNYSDWYGPGAGGVAYIGGFYNSAPNVGYVFEDALSNGNPRYVAEAASHEAGHLFGLSHQSLWTGSTLTAEYYQGDANWAPIMGVGYYSLRTTWHNGATSNGPNALQDNMAVLANASNGFGYRTDDFGSTLALASALAATNGNVNFAGLIGANTDEDWFSFTTAAGGALNLSLNVAQFGANLDSVLELRNAAGTVLVTANPSNSFGATLSYTLTSGNYFVVVKSSGGYGNVGQYTLTGTAPIGDGGGGEATPDPEIDVFNGATALQSGGSVNFGSVQVGQFVNKTITITNSGDATLTLTPPTAGNLPAGYSIITNFGTTSLAAGASTTLVLRFTPTTAGTAGGALTIVSNDADEGAFVINLTGTATPAPQPEIDVLIGATSISSGGSVSFGSVQVGQFVNKTITVKNTGDGVLTLTPPTAGNLPAGYSIITNFGTTSLAAGASTTLVLRFTPTAAGTAGGTLTLVSNDADEGAFVINLTGTATPAPQPEIDVLVGATSISSGGSVSFGSVQVGQFVNKTITVKNTGDGVLTLTPPTAGNLPAGYSIITNFATTSLAAGASTNLVLRFTPTTAGTAGGTLTLASNDADEGAFAINLTGTGTAIPGPQPEITVTVGTTGVLTGGSVNFGSVQVGKFVNQTITVKNTGNGPLTLTKPTAGDLPAGYSIITNFATTTLAAGASTTLTLRFTPTAVGAAGGTLTIASNDADESAFDINLTGTATPGPQPEITVNVGTTGVLTGGSVDFGSVQVTKYADKIITVKNTGTAALTLTKPTALQMPAGYSIVTNFASTSLAAGASTTLTLRFKPTAIGAAGGTLTIASNDADEGAFDINLTGTATPGPQPEITVSVGTTGVLTGGSVDFGSVQVTKYADKIITVKNTGAAPLTLTKPTALQMPAGYSIVTNFAATSLAAGASTTLTLRFKPTAIGAAGGTLTIASNDADEGAFDINLTGTATPGPQPEITVSVGTTGVLTGGSVDFGSVQVTKYADKIITVKNTGTAALTLTKPTALQMPAGYSIVTNFASTSLAAGASTTLTLRFKPTAVGTAGGTLTIASNDTDEGAFDINLTGTATPGPQPEITVNVGTTGVLTGGSVDFGSVQVTKYADKIITVKNTGAAPLTLTKPTALQMPAGYSIVTNFAATSLAAGASTTLTLRFKPTAIGAAGGTLTIASNDADESAFDINLTGTATPGPQPEITVNVGTTGVLTGGSVDFGSVQVGQSINKTITFKNTGTATLTLTKPTALAMPPGFSIATNFASTTLLAGQSATLTLKFTPTAEGNVSQTLSILSNDADESSFALNLTGTATPAPIIRAIDNGAAGFTTTGTWTRATDVGRESDIQTAVKGNGTTTATWTFTDLPPGQYRIHASWTANVTYATNAPFTVFDGNASLGTVLANQEQASSGLTWSGTNWKNLGVFSITGDTIRVQLTNAANDRVVADAVRVERIGDLPGGAAMAGSLLVSDLLPAAQLDAPRPMVGFAPYLGSAWFSTTARDDGGLNASAVDSLFAINDSRPELLLLDNALDLLRTTDDATSSSTSTRSDELASNPIGDNWLLGNELDALLT